MSDDVVVVIPTANTSTDLLRKTLASLSECVKPAGYRETIVVENGPKCGAEGVVAEFGSLGIRYVYEPMGNKSVALNRVLELLGDCLVVFTDDDVRLHTETLRAYADAAAGKEGGEFYGGPVSVDYESPPPPWLLHILPASAKGWLNTRKFDLPNGASVELCDECAGRITVDKPVFLGFNWAAFAGDLKAAGGFNKDRGPGAATGATGQESEMQRRLVKRGVRPRYVKDAMVWHHVPADRCSPEWTLRRWYRNGVGAGLEHVPDEAGAATPEILGLPTWVVSNAIGAGVDALIARVTKSMDSPVGYMARARLQWTRGFLRGKRLARGR